MTTSISSYRLFFKASLYAVLGSLLLLRCDFFDILPPEIEIISPVADTEYFGSVPVELNVTDNRGVDNVELFANDELIHEFSKSPYKTDIDLSQLSTSSVSLKAIAYDKAGNHGEVNREVTLATGFRLISPNGGEIWVEQTTQTINWIPSGAVGDNVGLYYSLDGALPWTSITNQTPNDGYYEWTLPNFSGTSSTCKVMVRSTSTNSADTSAYFSIIDLPGSDQIQKITASDAQSNDYFGYSVAISGNVAIVGAVLEDSGGDGAGAAYVFQRSGGSWTQAAKLTASDAQSDDVFGTSVAISGDIAIAGATEEGSSGAVYIFQGSGSSWTQVAKLTASDTYNYFGCSIAISGDVAIIGAYGGPGGAAYIFQGSGGSWTQRAMLIASDAQFSDAFGTSVAISGDIAIVGDNNEDSGGDGAGAAYVFQGSGGSWTQVAKLTASDAQSNDDFGGSVAIGPANGGTGSNVVIVGADWENSGGNGAGAAYVFQGSGGSWTQVAKLTASKAQSYIRFGCSVAINRDVAIIGAFGEDSGGDGAGAAYVFQGSGGSWTQVAKLIAPDAQSKDYFGRSVAISGDIVIIGAGWEDSGGSESGAAYVFE